MQKIKNGYQRSQLRPDECEVGIKHKKGKLDLPVSPSDWFDIIVRHHDLQVLPLDLDICIHSTQLPPIHNDPCDRMIIATAKTHGLAVVTTDETFKAYEIETLS